MVRFLIHRPIAVLVSTLALVVLGIITFFQLPVSLLPDIDIPEITVQVNYPAASARQLNQSIVKPIRNQLQQINHLADLEAITQDGLSVIKLRFDYGTNINLAYIEANEKIDALVGMLPREMPRPKVIKASAGDLPVFNINVIPLGREADFLSSSEFCENVLKRRIEQLPEVALVDMSGLSEPEVLIIPKPEVLQSLGMTHQNLTQLLQQNNLDLGSFSVKDGQYQYNLKFSSVLRTSQDIEQLYFKADKQSGRLLQVKDIATVQVREQKQRGIYTYNGQRAICLSIIKQSDTQLLTLRKSLNNLLANFKEDYPGLRFEVSQDQTELLDLSINNLTSNLLYGGLCAFIVIFLFLNNWKSSLLIGLTIPISLLITFLCFYLFGISINIVSLAGLVLGIGMVVDSSIIVVENIDQFTIDGKPIESACIVGTNEVILPLFTSILTNSAVFLPLLFMSGMAGALFYDQAVSVSLALGISLLCAGTLVPVVYLQLTKLFPQKQKSKREAIAVRLSQRLYDWLLKTAFGHKTASFIFFICLLVLGVWMALHIKKQGMPTMSRTELQVKIDWNESISLEQNKLRTQQLIKAITIPYTYASAYVGQQQFLLNRDLQQNLNESTLVIKVADEGAFQQLQKQLKTAIQHNFSQAIVVLESAPTIFEQLFNTSEPPLQIRIASTSKNGTISPEIIAAAYKKLQAVGLYVQLPAKNNQLIVSVLQEKILLYGVGEEQVFQTMKILFNENKIGNLSGEQRYVPIVIGGKEETINELLAKSFVNNEKGEAIPLQSLIEMHTIQDFKTFHAAKEGDFIPVNINISTDEIDSIQHKIKETFSEISDITILLSGSYFRNQRIINEMTVIMLIAILLLFFILAAQFESLVQPLIVMVAVVFGLSGSLILLVWSGSSLNIMSAIGMVVLIGIVDNDSILKIDTMNRSRNSVSLMEAITLAGKRRLKAQLMTSLTTIIGLLPTLFSSGLGAELQKPLALAVIGGMMMGSFISIVFIPLVYWLKYR